LAVFIVSSEIIHNVSYNAHALTMVYCWGHILTIAPSHYFWWSDGEIHHPALKIRRWSDGAIVKIGPNSTP